MTDFLELPVSERAEILNTLALKMGRSANLLEKDVWVCWMLGELFRDPEGIRMAFKGGTSLSKIFNAINRFSEDVDITVDYRDIAAGDWKEYDPFDPKQFSRTKTNRLNESLKDELKRYTHETVLPGLRDAFRQVTKDEGSVSVSESGEKLWLKYPTEVTAGTGYAEDSVLIEFGGRNFTEPHEKHVITADIADELPALKFPEAEVSVYSPVRTFWEKATLAHVECNRAKTGDCSRMSRHWYDLYMLYKGRIGPDALADRRQLEEVVKVKKVFYHYGWAKYDDCLSGKLRIIPDTDLYKALEDDFNRMRVEGMFYEDPPAFLNLIEELTDLEQSINELTSE